MCRRNHRGTLSCAVRASGGGGQSHRSVTGVWVSPVSELGGGLEGKNIFFPNVVFSFLEVLEVLEVDILWPRWVARIGVTRATEACFLTADRQCTELPLLRLPRLVPGVVGCDPFAARDLARVGWRGLRKARKHALRLPLLPIGPRERPRLADSFSRLGQARGASPGSLDQRSEESRVPRLHPPPLAPCDFRAKTARSRPAVLRSRRPPMRSRGSPTGRASC